MNQLADRGRLIPAHAGKTRPYTSPRLRCKAHPRSRGENRFIESMQNCWAGSSPLTRGKPELCKWKRDRLRLIPAHAGKTGLHGPGPAWSVAHPRSRGENRAPGSLAARIAGSSPLTRGKRAHHGHRPGRSGLIPAHAGKTAYPARWSLRRGAHPRSRGENRYTATYQVTAKGSSPLTRGKLVALPRLAHEEGLIPAHAGKT